MYAGANLGKISTTDGSPADFRVSPARRTHQGGAVDAYNGQERSEPIGEVRLQQVGTSVQSPFSAHIWPDFG